MTSENNLGNNEKIQESSILDQILATQGLEELSNFAPREVLDELFQQLDDRERDVVTRRFGLRGTDRTKLEEIGKTYDVTRERVRQIERQALRKLRAHEEQRKYMKPVLNAVRFVLEDHGGAMEEGHLLEELFSNTQNDDEEKKIFVFFMDSLLVDLFPRLRSKQHFLPGWRIADVDEEYLMNLASKLVDLIDEHGGDQNTPIPLSDLHQKAMADVACNACFAQVPLMRPPDRERHLQACLRLCRSTDRNIFDHWGLSHWPQVTPKRINDKIYLVLKSEGKPMHFREITDRINQYNFDHKKAYAETVHNELIMDDRFVLVGRGIYGLKTWGYRPGVVADIIEHVLREATTPLAKDAIIDEVLKQRMVRRETVYLALTNKNGFQRLPDGTYGLVEPVAAV